MSIFVENVSWSQTQGELFVNIPISGRKSADDIIITDKFLKINIYPYFFELFFEQLICVEQSSCKILESNIKFHLKKASDEWWSTLGKTAKSTGNLRENTISREKAREIYDEYEKNIQRKYAVNGKERSNLKRNGIDKEIERENQIRKKIDETESILKSRQITKVSFFVWNKHFPLVANYKYIKKTFNIHHSI